MHFAVDFELDHSFRPMPPTVIAAREVRRLPGIVTTPAASANSAIATPFTSTLSEPTRSCAIWAPSDIISPPITYPVPPAIADTAKILRISRGMLGSFGCQRPGALFDTVRGRNQAKANKIASTTNSTQKFRWVG